MIEQIGPKFVYSPSLNVIYEEGTIVNECGDYVGNIIDHEVYSPEGKHLGCELEETDTILWDNGDISAEY